MPFDELETQTRQNAPPTATISYCHATEKGKRGGAKPRLTIAIPTTVCGTSKSAAFKLLIGSGEDRGKLRIKGQAKTKAGDAKVEGVEPSQHAHFFRWNFGFVPLLGEDETFEGEKRPVKKINDEEFEIDVPPSWFEQ